VAIKALFMKPPSFFYILTVLLISLFVYLSAWQLNRVSQKQQLQLQLESRPLEAEILLENSPKYTSALRYRLARVQGTFMNEHHILMDNQQVKGRVGYRVFTPLKLANNETVLLIDRGFIPMLKHREEPIVIPPVVGLITLQGLINQPPNPLPLKTIIPNVRQWPVRVQSLQYETIAALLKHPISSFTLQLQKNDPRLFTEIPISFAVSAEKHLGYAIQWFMMALTVFIYACVRYHQEKKCAN
jgi:surfeit locus 1 family protein